MIDFTKGAPQSIELRLIKCRAGFVNPTICVLRSFEWTWKYNHCIPSTTLSLKRIIYVFIYIFRCSCPYTCQWICDNFFCFPLLFHFPSSLKVEPPWCRKGGGRKFTKILLKSYVRWFTPALTSTVAFVAWKFVVESNCFITRVRSTLQRKNNPLRAHPAPRSSFCSALYPHVFIFMLRDSNVSTGRIYFPLVFKMHFFICE